MNFRHNIWGYFEVTDPFEVTNEVTEIFDFQNFSRQFAHFCSSYEKASKCYEEIEMWNSGFLRDRIDYQTVSCCVVISFPQGQVIKSRVFEPKYWPLCVKSKRTSVQAVRLLEVRLLDEKLVLLSAAHISKDRGRPCLHLPPGHRPLAA